MPKNLNSLRTYLFAFLVIAAPLSLIPSIALPALDFPSFRLGLYQIIATLFIAITIIPLYKDLSKLYSKNKVAYTAIAVAAVAAFISLLFSQNQTRGVLLTASFIVLLLTLLCAWWYVAFQLKDIPKHIANYLIALGVIFALLAVAQLIWGTYASGGGLLCKGCSNAVFGFPRVNVTAAEPLFFANALLPTLIITFYLSIHKYKHAALGLFATTFAIGLTFARGAYLAAAIGILSISALLYINNKANFKQISRSIVIMLFAGLVSITFLLGSATVKFSSTTPNITYNTFQSIVEHLSLGVVSLPDKKVVIISVKDNNPSNDFESPGLIEASTNERLDSAKLAIDAWQDNLKNLAIGTGLGNLGPYVVSNINANAPSNLTVYIFYILFLAELGLVGITALLVLLANIIYKLYKKTNTSAVYIVVLGIILAFVAQYFFFGSYINVVYVWLWLGIALGILSNKNLTFQGIIGKE